MKRFGLRLQMTFVIATMILLVGIAGAIHAHFTLSQITRDELDRRALVIARKFEADATESFPINDIFRLHRQVMNVVEADSDVLYAIFMDSSGGVQLSTFGASVPAGLREANRVPQGEAYRFTILATNQGEVRDLSYRLAGEDAGEIRIGLSTTRGQQRVDQFTANLLGLTGLALGSGLLVSYFIAAVLTRPLARLAEAARAVARGERARHSDLHNHPDLGEVAVAFDHMTETLQERDRERTTLMARMLKTQEDERRRIARELHDDAGQELTSLLLEVTRLEETAGNPALAGQVASIRATANRTLDLTRDIARSLRPSTLDDIGLPDTLRRFVSDYGRKYQITAQFRETGFDDARLPPECETALYRIAQEALTNVLRHAQASRVTVTLSRCGDRAALTIEDDGRGFDLHGVRQAQDPAGKLGLLGMEERAALVGGDLRIRSLPGSGTAVLAEVPLKEEP